MRRWTILPIVLAAVPLAVVAAPIVETQVQRTETWANLGTAFGGFATGGGAILGAYFLWSRQRKKDAEERDARIKREKEEREIRWQTLVDDTAGQVKRVREDLTGRLAEHAVVHAQIRSEVSQVGADVRALTTSFTGFLQHQLARSQADSATGD